MTAPSLVPCIWLDDQAEAAAAFYTQTFADGRVTATSRYPEDRDNPGERPRGSVLTVELELAGQRFTLLNGGPIFRPNPSISMFVHVDDTEAAAALFGQLAEGGQVMMALGAYPWSAAYGWVADRFGVSWQVITGRRPAGGATIVPCLMFTGAKHGKAEQALGQYAAAFAGGRVDRLERYAAGEGPDGSEGTIKHGRAILAGSELLAMDAQGEHRFDFDEGLSLQVMCADQAEVDHYWAALGDGGRPSQCGWLTDRFGVSWQVVPETIAAWMTTTDTVARDRAFAAMMTMTKLDVAALQRAFDGT